jgi:membrane protein DedA with SNARE-associated domain
VGISGMTYFFTLFLGTLVLEDLTLASSLALMSESKISFEIAFWACFLGISVGDLGLYFIGLLVARSGVGEKFKSFRKYRPFLNSLKQSQLFTYSILISRLVPGTRVPTYFSAGYLRYSFFRFFCLTLFSVSLWVYVALVAGRSLSNLLMDHWIYSVLIFLLVLKFLKSYLPRLVDPWERKALGHSWRKWLPFEFWPAWLFYLPIIPYYILLSIKHRSLFMPFYANPHLEHGGLIGESKWDLLKHLPPEDSASLKTLKISRQMDFLSCRDLLESQGLSYPFIIKPDVGQRGFAVRIIRNDFDLTEYLLLADFDRIIQELSLLPHEAGIFYVRLPSQPTGSIFSLTDKKFPIVVGDGRQKLAELILNDARAKIIAPIYFSRHRDKLNCVLEKGQVYLLSECGNHCQGAIFRNGQELITDLLAKRIDQLAKTIPDFYFGRFDVRYLDAESLKKGKSFKIVEVNGAGSEATHIWDKDSKLLDAYKTLFHQWALLFQVGDELSQIPGKKRKLKIFSFLKECLSVCLRKSSLGISS